MSAPNSRVLLGTRRQAGDTGPGTTTRPPAVYAVTYHRPKGSRTGWAIGDLRQA